MSSSQKSTDPVEPLPLKNMEENLQELLERCRKLRQSASQKPQR